MPRVPGGQAEHSADPAVGWIRPTTQATHSVWLEFGWNFPTSQSSQLSVDALPRVPGRQSEQVPIDVRLLPGVHFCPATTGHSASTSSDAVAQQQRRSAFTLAASHVALAPAPAKLHAAARELTTRCGAKSDAAAVYAGHANDPASPKCLARAAFATVKFASPFTCNGK